MRTPGLRDWFRDDELTACVHCGARAAVPKEAPFAVCLECGAVLKAEAAPEPARLSDEP
jgi:predicted nucleic acid-binding Zn ribbon protein